MGDTWQDDNIIIAQVRDDDDDIPDDWENEPEEKPKKSEADVKPKVPVKAPPTTKNKQVKKKYVGDDHASDEEFLESLKEPNRKYTAEELDELEKRAELQKEELKLKMASDFVGTGGQRQSLDDLDLTKKDEFLDYSFRLYNRLQILSKSEFYLDFLDHLLNGLTKSMSADHVRRMTGTLQQILTRKQNEEKEKKNLVNRKKPQLKDDRRAEYDSFVGDGITAVEKNEEYDEDNDFM